eukprot:scaffold1560_cov146-Skeletonema_dohrnii-CCMP3373.AAC.6
MQYIERIRHHHAKFARTLYLIRNLDTLAKYEEADGTDALLKSKFTGAVALILNTRPALIGFAIILVLHIITTAHCSICNTITVLSTGNGRASSLVATASSVWKVAVLITLAIAVAVAPTLVLVTWSEMHDSRQPICGSHAFV